MRDAVEALQDYYRSWSDEPSPEWSPTRSAPPWRILPVGAASGFAASWAIMAFALGGVPEPDPSRMEALAREMHLRMAGQLSQELEVWEPSRPTGRRVVPGRRLS
jgi:hypothetical protein